MDFAKLLDRVKNILTNPKAEWPVIAAEPRRPLIRPARAAARSRRALRLTARKLALSASDPLHP